MSYDSGRLFECYFTGIGNTVTIAHGGRVARARKTKKANAWSYLCSFRFRRRPDAVCGLWPTQHNTTQHAQRPRVHGLCTNNA